MDECCFVFMMFFGNKEEHVNKPIFSPPTLTLFSVSNEKMGGDM